MNKVIVGIPEQFITFLSMYRIILDEKSAIEVYQELLHLCYNTYYLGDQVESDGNSITIAENIICILEYCMTNNGRIEIKDLEPNSFYSDVFNAMDMFIYYVTPIIRPLGFFNSTIDRIKLGGRIFDNKMIICY